MTINLNDLLGQFVPCQLDADLEKLAPEVRDALPDLATAIRGMDRLFQQQLGEHVVQLAQKYAQDEYKDTLEAKAFFHFNSPYDKLNGNKPFLEGVQDALPGKALYPNELTRKEFQAYLEAHPEEKDELLSPYTIVEKRGERFIAIPFHERYGEALLPVIESLENAAKKLKGSYPDLANFLEGRAKAFAGRYSFIDSDADWVRLKNTPLEVVIGPFEQYEDELMGVKAFYEGMLLAIDAERCATLSEIEQALPTLAEKIPCPANSKSSVGGLAPMIVADLLLAGGEAYTGILPSAFNLPNDPGVRGRVGWKQIMIRNVMEAKFDNCTRKIAQQILVEDQVQNLSFDSYFFTVLLHEVTHGLGPAYRENGRSVNEACGPHYTSLEEAKADTGALLLLLTFNGQFGIPSLTNAQIGASYAAGLFRSARFGIHEAHGKANVIQYSFFKEKGAIRTENGKIRPVPSKFLETAQALLLALTTLQASGTEKEIQDFLDKYATPPQDLIDGIESLKNLPIDILPSFVL